MGIKNPEFDVDLEKVVSLYGKVKSCQIKSDKKLATIPCISAFTL
jgi:hypothetical protein